MKKILLVILFSCALLAQVTPPSLLKVTTDGNYEIVDTTKVLSFGKDAADYGFKQENGEMLYRNRTGTWQTVSYTNRISHIYSMGNSLTSPNAYQETLIDSLGYPWGSVNKGIAGETTTQMLARFTVDIITPGLANYVIIMGGVNDILGGVYADVIESNLQAMYTAAHNAGISVIAVNISPCKGVVSWTSNKQLSLDSVNTWIANTASNVDFKIDIYSLLNNPGNAGALQTVYDSGDNLHWTTVGQDSLASRLYHNVTWVSNPLSTSGEVVETFDFISSSARNKTRTTFFGLNTGLTNTGTLVTGFGFDAMLNNTGNGSAGYGYYALVNNSGSDANGFGYNALSTNTAAKSNGFGTLALYANTGANTNGYGYNVLAGNTGADCNGFGYNVLMINNAANNNAYGNLAMSKNVTGYNNAAFGYKSMLESVGGANNSAFGHYSLTGNVDGWGMSAFGYYAGASLTGGSRNTFFGYNSGYNGLQLAAATNSMALGNGTYTTASNQVVIGDTSVNTVLMAQDSGAVVLASAFIAKDSLAVGTTKLTVPDYVFEDSYKQNSIEEMRDFYKTNKHLPTMPSEKEVKSKPINIMAYSMRLLETIEVQAKYISDLELRISALEKK